MPSEIDEADHDLQHRGKRNGKSYLKQGGAGDAAHKEGHRNPDAEGPYNSVKHYKGSAPAPVKVSGKAEEEGYKERVDGVGPQIEIGRASCRERV